MKKIYYQQATDHTAEAGICWTDGVERFVSGYTCFDSQEQ